MIDETVKAMAQAKNFATITAMLPSGQFLTQVMWVDADDEHVLINTEIGRAKEQALRADPRVTVTIIDAANPYRYVEVRGRVVEFATGPEARAHIDAVSQKYTGNPYPPDAIGTERVILRIAPDRQRVKA
jgi:PPOX class probable F420-dependent enzyme